MPISEAMIISLVERGIVPDPIIRAGIRQRLRKTLSELPMHDCERAAEHKEAFIAMLDDSPVAAVPERANEQHYEVPAEFFATVLGPRRKYSSCWWPTGVTTLEQAEEASLAETALRAGVDAGMDVLELGCGWGSFSLWAAEQFSSSRFTAVSNSSSQRAYIEGEAKRRGIENLTVITADMNAFAIDQRFDRIVSLEMFEHMRNWRTLFARVHDWLEPGGRFFMHVFCHRDHPYPYEDTGPDDWMSHYFFAGGIMPSDDLPLHFQQRLQLVDRWRWDGRHYEKTLNAWLARMDTARAEVWPILETTYGKDQVGTWWMRWRLFFMACAELFGLHQGQEWYVGHYLFERPGAA
ncbi:SAM-dependent methyltransferase [Halochromatium salexigens]|uniref:SAM-dependent methyltransferase n=1 Tax=Halochromatium salexigens TaxID=49447 RepID=A0AAJ0UGX3_HALSE|nr:cyclopropane-fatty-acyl-phospholipid synthase family protein [Halochromatium salexigens]MBK5931264.1 SAM-dependent methyltransferase [Halochromatium salexigens]